MRNFDVLLAVHLSIILVIDQINAQNSCFIMSLLYSATCFEHYCAHHQEVKLIIKQEFCALSWSVTKTE